MLDRRNAPVRQEFFSISELAARWRCSRGSVYNRLRQVGARVLDFSTEGRKGKKAVPAMGISGQQLSGEQLVQAVESAQGMLPQYQAQFVNNQLQVVMGASDLQSMGIPLSPAMQMNAANAERILNTWLQNVQW